MASACAWSVALVGLEGRIVEVEADIGAGLPRTVLVGLPDSALYQARDLTRTDPEWREQLDATLMATRRDDLEHGTNAAYVQGCACNECRNHQRIRMARNC